MSQEAARPVGPQQMRQWSPLLLLLAGAGGYFELRATPQMAEAIGQQLDRHERRGHEDHPTRAELDAHLEKHTAIAEQIQRTLERIEDRMDELSKD